MVWQAIVNAVAPDASGGIIIDMTFTDNVSQKVAKEYRLKSFDLDTFKRTVQADLDAQSSSDTQKINLPLGPFDTTIVPPDPTPRDLFATDLVLLGHYQAAVNLNVLPNTDPNFQAQLKKVQQGFDPSFITVF